MDGGGRAPRGRLATQAGRLGLEDIDFIDFEAGEMRNDLLKPPSRIDEAHRTSYLRGEL
jgi:hypothetical protein